jgi:hypothetical protein
MGSVDWRHANMRLSGRIAAALASVGELPEENNHLLAKQTIKLELLYYKLMKHPSVEHEPLPKSTKHPSPPHAFAPQPSTRQASKPQASAPQPSMGQTFAKHPSAPQPLIPASRTHTSAPQAPDPAFSRQMSPAQASARHAAAAQLSARHAAAPQLLYEQMSAPQ